MTTKFTINDTFVDIEIEKTILEVKQLIIKTLELTCPYIDLIITIDRPIRCLGKFNLEPGKLPRTCDNYQLNRWELTGKTIQVDIQEIQDYNNKKIVKKSSSTGLYRPKIKTIESGETYIQPTYDIESDKDFPKLG